MSIDENGYMIDGLARPKATLILAHGAGAPMDSEFMQVFAQAVAQKKIRVVRFEFPYMAQRRMANKKRPPDRLPVLQRSWLQVIDHFKRAKNLFIGGKSMGGRIASMVADEANVDGLICLGYPFHPPGKPERLRIDHLVELRTRSLILQGERDTFGKREEVEAMELSSRIQIRYLNDGDHGFKPRKSSGTTFEQNLQTAVETSVSFMLE